ncbi:MAG: hypothetical protein ABDH21_01385 [bacterium]
MKNNSLKFKLLTKIIISVILGLVLFTFVYSNSAWKIRIKGITREVNTNPIIKGTSVFVDIYDLSNLFKIDYEVNLTRKLITFYRDVSITVEKPEEKQVEKPIEKPSEKQLENPPQKLNSLMLNKINAIKTVLIVNAINEVKEIEDNNYSTYSEDIENVQKVLNSYFSEKGFKSIVIDNNFRIDKLEIPTIVRYLKEKDIDGAIVPVLKKYYYYEKDGNNLVPTVELQINYVLVNQAGEIVFFNVQNIIRNLAIISSSSVRYRKSKLLDLVRMSVDLFIRDFNEYVLILSQEG